MATFQITNAGSPIYPIQIGIEADINVQQSFSQEVTIEHTVNSTAFNIEVATVLSACENAYKTLPQFTTQDSNRNGTSSWVALGGNSYRIDMSWTIENAVVGLSAETQTDLEGQAQADFLQSLADATVNTFKAQWSWVNL